MLDFFLGLGLAVLQQSSTIHYHDLTSVVQCSYDLLFTYGGYSVHGIKFDDLIRVSHFHYIGLAQFVGF
jgi:hypothetical protein